MDYDKWIETHAVPRGHEHTLSKAYQNWLQTWPVDYFFTGTFRTEPSVNGARRALERFFKSQDLKPSQAFLCIEHGERYGRVHTHGLLCYPDRGLFHPAGLIQSRWNERNGFATVENPKSLSDVSGYCSKYCTKTLNDETYIIL